MKKCSIDGCDKPHLARTWCATHYQRWRTTGSPGGAALLRVPGRPDVTEKPCTRCKVIKRIDEFYADKRNRDGRMSYCIECFGRKQTNTHRQRKYGITTSDYEEMLEAQGGRCTICHEESKLVIDHCHRGGQVRSLLCDRCNRLLGIVDDNQSLLLQAVEFLKQHQ